MDEAKVTAATGFFAKAVSTLCKADSGEIFEIWGSVLGVYHGMKAGSKGKENPEKLEAVRKLVAAMFEGLKVSGLVPWRFLAHDGDIRVDTCRIPQRHFESSLDLLFDMASAEKQTAETLLKSRKDTHLPRGSPSTVSLRLLLTARIAEQGQAMEVLTQHFSQVICNKKESPQMKKTVLCPSLAPTP